MNIKFDTRSVLRFCLFIFLSSIPQAYSQVPANPFGIGAHYLGFNANSTQQRTEFRNAHLLNAASLIGEGGHVRIWCHIDTIWSFPNEQGPAECARAVQRAHDLNLVPVVVIQESPSHDANEVLNPLEGYKSFSQFSNKVKGLVSGLPRPQNRVLWIEMANEPNFTDWWPSYTCSHVVRAKEVARQTYQTILAVRSLNDPKIKILGPSLSPYGDYDPSPTVNQLCSQRGVLGLSSVTFAAAMKKEVPQLFAPVPMFDAWNSHAYPDHLFEICGVTGKPACASDYNNQHGMTAYRKEIQTLGLPADFPVMITEASLHDNGESGAQKLAQLEGVRWKGTYHQVWFAKKDFNNVKAVMGYLLGSPNGGGFNFMDPWLSLGPIPQWSQQTPIFRRLYDYRIAVLPSGKMAAGRYLLPSGAIYYVNGNDHACAFSSWDDYLRSGGSGDLSGVKEILRLSVQTIVDGYCYVQ